VVIIRRGWDKWTLELSNLELQKPSHKPNTNLTLIRTCYFETKVEQAQAKGAKIILFYWVSSRFLR
jgi:hypothetical protein